MKHNVLVFAALTILCMNFPPQSLPSTAANAQPISLLPEFRPIGGTGNNLENASLDVVPDTPELELTPLNFARGTDDGLVNGPNPRTISDVIAGGDRCKRAKRRNG